MMKIDFILNGNSISVEAPPDLTLMLLLRENLGLTGTKCGCSTGDCGACSVLLDDQLTKSCQVAVSEIGGRRVTTIEGIHGNDGDLSDLQKSFLRHGAIQCGYCIPAMVLAGEALLRHNPAPDRDEIREGIDPVLCRCIGYQQIVDAIEETANQRQGLLSGRLSKALESEL